MMDNRITCKNKQENLRICINILAFIQNKRV